jgi:hypothetical protein
MVKKILISLAVFFVLAVIIVAIVRGLSSLNIDIPFFGNDDEVPTTEQTPESTSSSSGGSSFFASARDAFFSPIGYFTGSASTTATPSYFSPTYGEINISDSFSPEDYARYQEAWGEFETGPDDTAASSSADAYFDTSLYFGPSSTDEAQHFGDPSAWYRKVAFAEDGHSFGWYGEVNPPQYVTIESLANTEEPVNISGWSLQSMNTGIRLYIPHGVRVLRTGQAAQLQSITLTPGEKAIVGALKSPVGVSFKENICSGYLTQFQTFTPPLEHRCPSAASELPQTPANTEAFGATCYEFLSYIPRCEFQTDPMPEYLSANCANFVRERITYNGCVNAHASKQNFLTGVWRVYLNTPSAPWESNDIIRLLDAEGRVVDVLRI